MFTIKRHAVRLDSNGLSATQNLLYTADTAPVLIIGAPTGAGKTYGFQRWIQDAQGIALFIVPTQALARNICESLNRSGIYAKRWDSEQTREAVAQGQITWSDRLHSLTLEAGQQGGMIIATLEAFHGITLGRPDRHQVNLRVADVLDHIDYLVIDEAHLLNERAFGFVALWAALVAYRRQLCGGRTRLALLSATHSDLADWLTGSGDDAKAVLPPEWVQRVEETVINLEPDDSPSSETLRVIHGQVSVTLRQGRLADLASTLIPELLSRHERVMVVYDSLAEFGLDERLWAKMASACELSVAAQAPELWIVNSQDRPAGRTLGSAALPAGHEIPDTARLIIGTSALEVGLNLPKVTALITDRATNAGALLQRIGRAARDDCAGEAYVVYHERQRQKHLVLLEALNGILGIEAVREKLKPLVELDKQRAMLLGSAYLSMLGRQNRNLDKGLDQVMSAIESRYGQRPLSKGSLLDAAHGQVGRLLKQRPNYRYRDALEQWLKAIDQELQDLRGFLPTVQVRFGDSPIVECSADFVGKRLPPPDDWEGEHGEVLVYRRPRDAYLKASLDAIDIPVLTPFGEETICAIKGIEDLMHRYRRMIRECRQAEDGEVSTALSAVIDFAAQSGLIPRVRRQIATNANKSGSRLV